MKHSFVPTHYYRTLGSHDPVLRVSDGDQIFTTTVDARGFDHERNAVTQRGNPQTGPFYVEDAEPGDTLVVELDSIRPNRSYGFCGSSVAPNVVRPDYVPQLPLDAPLAEWDVDVSRGTAILQRPESKLGAIELPLDPMIGCFGVAAKGGQAISTATSAEHGGNMDYRGFTVGTTVYFPVFEPGALFFLGDGHAVQGDGEIVGSGIEISMDVEITLRLQKGKTIGWPRGENDQWIFTTGNARPLDEATQIATTEMLIWLQQDFGLDALGANLLLAQCVRYELGNMFDPAYTMVCKVAKSWLPG
ncbi:MAG: acetamidase/formamidase family protein [Planctomycetota bacterium]|jgi:acetamidase/formamidase|nr:acetamidase/formamidase family protein [Planctomycetota bacterium]|tara:strand:+ start:262 stop:1170 length:909 start_codon:yes stop_codon:yes gene_type:complete